jgi:NAD(P)H-hydrate epimerase
MRKQHHLVPALSAAELREFDRRATDHFHIPSCVLMENAGRAATDVLLSFCSAPTKVIVVCGRGNNGGDGLVMARHLDLRGMDVTIVSLDADSSWSVDAGMQRSIVHAIGIGETNVTPQSPLDELARLAAEADWIVDAILGTGSTGAPRDLFARVITTLNASRKPIFAVDIPSGLDCDRGTPQEPTIRARITCTMVASKKGFANPAALPYLGEVHVVDIGIGMHQGP